MRTAALTAKRESKSVDFKRSFDQENAGEWCELLKDVVAMANSGGGTILIGVNNDGTPSRDASIARVLEIDPAVITDKIAKYTSVQFDGVSLTEAQRGGATIAVLSVSSGVAPMVFERVGAYPLPDGKQKTAFGQGTVYFRHGAKSEPATTEDLRLSLERRLQQLRREWLSGVRKVVEAPTGSVVSVLPPGIRLSQDANAMPIRLTNSPSAPEYRLVDPDVTHPWRQKELLQKINEKLPLAKRINQHHLRAVRLLYQIDVNHEYFHKSKFSSPQYSAALYEWMLDQFARDSAFFGKAVEEIRRRQASV